MPTITVEISSTETAIFFVGMVLSVIVLFVLPVLLHTTYENGDYYIPGVGVLYLGVFISSLTCVVPELHPYGDIPVIIFLWGAGIGIILLLAGLILSYRNYSCFFKENAKYATSRY